MRGVLFFVAAIVVSISVVSYAQSPIIAVNHLDSQIGKYSIASSIYIRSVGWQTTDINGGSLFNQVLCWPGNSPVELICQHGNYVGNQYKIRATTVDWYNRVAIIETTITIPNHYTPVVTQPHPRAVMTSERTEITIVVRLQVFFEAVIRTVRELLKMP